MSNRSEKSKAEGQVKPDPNSPLNQKSPFAESHEAFNKFHERPSPFLSDDEAVHPENRRVGVVDKRKVDEPVEADRRAAVNADRRVAQDLAGFQKAHPDSLDPIINEFPSLDLPPDAHAEAVFAADSGNKEFAVREPLTANVVAVQAWNDVRGNDPEFKDCVQTHQQKLVAHAESSLKGGSLMQGDSPMARFERRVVELNRQ